ncbi:MAG: hypothetical protein K5981_01740 [Clostridia bacterium]|jgi:hypothetical protein|nr:hypothetical protein [Clostridia bacterium]
MRNRKSIIILVAAALILAASFHAFVFGDNIVPGTASDPVVSKSYMDAQIKVLQDQITALTEQLSKVQSGQGSQGGQSGSQTPAPSGDAPVFEVVRVESGQSIIAGASAEIILRSGTAIAIASESGGVSDVTGGTDLPTGTAVTKNHLLIIPADDGRGITCTSMCYVMVKGSYTLN